MLVLAAVLLSGCGSSEPASGSSDADADEKIVELTDSKAYAEANIEQRKAMAEDLLTKLKKEKKILDFSYFDDDSLFSFEYPDHSLGGIYLKGFGTESDGLPMN